MPENMRRHVSFPRLSPHLRKIQTDLHAIAGFPGAIGVIDGTHVRFISPKVDDPEYVNRKGFHSINVQVCVDSQHKFTDLVAGWPRATRDSRILTYSGLKQLLENEMLPVSGHLIGDSGYPLKTWLLTPYLRPNTEAERRYNSALKITRAIVEHTIGQWKRRFHVLHSEIRLEPSRACNVIAACACLHNYARERNLPFEEDNENNDPDAPDDYNLHDREENIGGIMYRRQITETHFR